MYKTWKLQKATILFELKWSQLMKSICSYPAIKTGENRTLKTHSLSKIKSCYTHMTLAGTGLKRSELIDPFGPPQHGSTVKFKLYNSCHCHLHCVISWKQSDKDFWLISLSQTEIPKCPLHEQPRDFRQNKCCPCNHKGSHLHLHVSFPCSCNPYVPIAEAVKEASICRQTLCQLG